MKVLIEAPFDISDTNRAIIEEKVNKFSTFFDKITQTSVFFKKDDGNEPDSILAEVEVHLPGPTVFASATATQFMDAFVGAANKTETQLRKRHDKMVSHH